MSVPVVTASGGSFKFNTSITATDAGVVKLFGTVTVRAGVPTPTNTATASQQTFGAPANNPLDRSRPTTVSGNGPVPLSPISAPPVTPSAAINPGSGGSSGVKGLNAFDAGQSNFISGFGPLDAEPPDQGLCVGNGFVLETINQVIKVYDTSFSPLTFDIPLVNLVGFPIAQQFGVSSVGGGYILSDPRCLYDTQTGHWFMSFLYLGGEGVYSVGPGPYPLGSKTYGAEFVLASQTTSPIGKWNIYMWKVTQDPLATNCPCFGDQPLLGADRNTIIVSTNEYSVFASTQFFNGAQAYLFDKDGLVEGRQFVNFAHFNIGLQVTTPDGSCEQAPTYVNCWYSVAPAISPTTASFDTSNGGTAWAMSALDFTGAGDNRFAIWSFTDTSSIDSSQSITLNLYLGTGLQSYFNPGFLVPQKHGPIPLGDVVYSSSPSGCAAKCAVGGLASNGDGTWDTVTYAQGAIWGAVNTLVNEGTPSKPSYFMGAAYWVVNAASNNVKLASQGYVAATGEHLVFPSIAAGPTGNGIIVFTLTGHDYYPSSAFAWISKTSGGAIGGQIYITDKGKSPQDGFTEYQSQQNSLYRPRWGDYTWAVWSNGNLYYSTEYIQSPNCSDAAFISSGGTCGGTRDPFANFGTSLNVVPGT